MKVALIPGHTKDRKGAQAYNGISEYDYNLFVAHIISNLHQFNVRHGLNSISDISILTRDQGWGSIVSMINKHEIDMTLELHFNSFHRPASGVETLAMENDTGSIAFAKFLSSRLGNEYRSRLRADDGVKEVMDQERGYHNLAQVRSAGASISVLVEPGFLNFKNPESEVIVSNPLRYANIIYKILEQWIDADSI